MPNPFRGVVLATALIWPFLASSSHAQDAAIQEVHDLADGSRPASAALQRLIDESAGQVHIPAGTFLLDAPLRVDLPARGYRSICGALGATRLVMTCAGPALEILGAHEGTAFPGSVEDHTWEKERFPVVSGLEILGKHAEADGIALRRTMKCTIQNVLVRRCRYGIHLVERNRNVLIADSHIYDCTDSGVFFDRCNLHQINISANHISYCRRAGIRQTDGDVHNVQIAGNDIEYNAGSGELSGEIMLDAPQGIISEYSIAGNTIQARPENPGANIVIMGGTDNAPFAARTMAITGNVIGDRDKNILLSRASRITISGNTVYGGKTLNIHVRQCGNILVNGNTVGTRPSMHATHDLHDDGVLLEDCSDCLLANNILSEHRSGSREQGGAVMLCNARRCRISGCQIANPRVRGVHVIGGMGCVVSDNSVMASGAQDFVAAIEISGAGRAHLVQNNWICCALEAPVIMKEGGGESRNNTVVPPEASEGPAAPAE